MNDHAEEQSLSTSHDLRFFKRKRYLLFCTCAGRAHFCILEHYDPWGLNLAGIEKQGNPDHKFQYNGKEKHTELGLNWMGYGARMYDAQLGRFLTQDRLGEIYLNKSIYAYVGNNPINNIDVNGDFIMSADDQINYPHLAKLLRTVIPQMINNPKVMANLIKFTGLSRERIEKDLAWGNGPLVSPREGLELHLGEYTKSKVAGTDQILKINQSYLVKNLESMARSKTVKQDELDAITFLSIVTIIHEYVHYGRFQNGWSEPYEYGKAWEISTFGHIIHDYSGDITGRGQESALYYVKTVERNSPIFTGFLHTGLGFWWSGMFGSSDNSPVNPPRKADNPTDICNCERDITPEN